MVPTTYKMRVQKITDHTSHFRELVLETIEPKEFQFKAGQFVMLEIPHAEKPITRAYSMASSDEQKNGFRLIFKKIDSGIASEFIWSLKENSELSFTGPFGHLFFEVPPTEQVLFINTGSGLTQHFCFLESQIKKYPQQKYRMLIGLRTEDCIYYHKELEALKKHFVDFQYNYVISRPSPSYTGKKGYVQNHIKEFDYLKVPTTFYLCGNGPMIKDLKKQLIENDNFDPARIHVEAFD